MLIPFDPQSASLITKYYMDPEYANWSRDIKSYLSVSDCARLPEIIRAEVLHIIEEGSAIGLVSLWDESPEVYAFGIVIDKEFRKKGFAKKTVEELCDYVRDKKGGRLILAYTVEPWFNEAWKDWHLIGCIPDYSLVNGKYVNTYYSYKRLR